MKKIDLTEGKVINTLLALAVPIMGSSLLQFTYNLVDMLWVGHLGSGSVASIGSSSFFINMGYAVNAMIMMGTGIKVSHCAGKKDQKGIEAYIRTGMNLCAIIGLLFAAVLIIFGQGFIGFLGLRDAVIEQDAVRYLAWHAPVLFFAFFNNVFARVSASLGNSKSALKISAVGIALNIFLDPVFIYVFKWGIIGAAGATLVANVIMFSLYLIIGKEFFKLDLRLKMDIKKAREIMRLGLPIAMQRILFTGINIMLAKMIASFGAEAVAAQKIGVQIESVTYMVTGGLNGAMASFIGQNYGAEKYERLRSGYKSAMIIGMVYAAVSGLVFWIIPEQLAGLFVKEQTTIHMAADYLRVIAYSQIFNAMEMVSSGFFSGIGKPKVPSMVSMVFTALRLPMAYGLISISGVNGIWWSITLSTLLKGSVLIVIYLINGRNITLKKMHKEKI